MRDGFSGSGSQPLHGVPARAARSSGLTADQRASEPSQARGDGTGESASDDVADSGHRVTVEWLGQEVETLADLLSPQLMAVVVGINPAPISVAAGHYWQGNTGRTLWRRLRAVGLLPEDGEGHADDAAFAAGIGFTDVVKRPRPSADDVTQDELEVGRSILEEKLERFQIPLIIFAFKKAATTLLGAFEGNGLLPPNARLGARRIFVMPGPYEATETSGPTLDALAKWVQRSRQMRSGAG